MKIALKYTYIVIGELLARNDALIQLHLPDRMQRNGSSASELRAVFSAQARGLSAAATTGAPTSVSSRRPLLASQRKQVAALSAPVRSWNHPEMTIYIE